MSYVCCVCIEKNCVYVQCAYGSICVRLCAFVCVVERYLKEV